MGAASLVLVAVVAVTVGLVASRATGRQRVANPTVVEEVAVFGRCRRRAAGNRPAATMLLRSDE